jgi:hypothetical protein
MSHVELVLKSCCWWHHNWFDNCLRFFVCLMPLFSLHINWFVIVFEDFTVRVMKGFIFWGIMLRSRFEKLCSSLFMLVSCLSKYWILKVESLFSSKMLYYFQQTAWLYIPEDRTLCSRCCENLKFCWLLNVCYLSLICFVILQNFFLILFV